MPRKKRGSVHVTFNEDKMRIIDAMAAEHNLDRPDVIRMCVDTVILFKTLKINDLFKNVYINDILKDSHLLLQYMQEETDDEN